MNNITELANLLQNRLPELEWKLNNLNIPLTTKIMPSGLFKSKTEINPCTYIEEIRSDLKSLKQQTSESSALYLATLISRKLHVLVNLCKQAGYKKTANESNLKFTLRTIGNRQKWLEDWYTTLTSLTKQQAALQQRLEMMTDIQDSHAKLNLQAELGKVAKLLTEAREAVQKIEAQGYV